MTEAAEVLMYELLGRQRRLLGRLSTAPRGDPARRRDQLRKQLEAEAAGCIDACLAVDAMTPAEGKTWMDRLTAVSVEATEDVGDGNAEAAGKARAVLAEELANLVEAQSNRVPVSLTYSRFTGFLRAYEQLDVLSEEEGAAWRTRAAPEQKPTPEPRGLPGDYEAFELRRAVAGPRDRKRGVRLISIEFYADCTIARWHVNVREAQPAAPPARTSAAELDLRAHLADDIGTSYETVPGPYDREISVANAESVRGQSIFVPAAPDNARRVTFTILSESFEVALPADAAA